MLRSTTEQKESMALASTQYATAEAEQEKVSLLPKSNRRTDLPVLLIHNLDETWDPADLEKALDEVDDLETALRSQGHPVTNIPVYDSDLAGRLRHFDPDEHIVFNGCESLPGIPPSEAMVAQILESLGFTYTGSTPEVLATGWDKAKVKKRLGSKGMPIPTWKIFTSPQQDGWRKFPAIVKPSREHSSCGVSRDAVVLSHDEMLSRIAYVEHEFKQPAIVEDFIDGREFHVFLWGNQTVEMLPPAEMDFSAFNDVRDRLCTFDAKHKPDSRAYAKICVRTPAALPEAESKELERLAQRAYRAIGCRDCARLDIRLRNDVFYILDVNPNPDISSDTSMAFAAELAGYSYGAMLSQMVNLAALRHPVFRY
jgi:D-alanine-D-alanine ligase